MIIMKMLNVDNLKDFEYITNVFTVRSFICTIALIFLYIHLNCVSFKCLQLCDINELTKRDAREEDDSW